METILRDISLVWLLAHCLIMFLMMFESRLSERKTFTISTIFFIIITPINLGNIYLFGVETAAVFIPFTCVLPSLILFYFMARNRDLRFWFTFCLADTIILWIMVLTKFLDVVSNIPNHIILLATRVIFVLIIEFLIYKFARKPYQDLQNKITKGWGIFAITSTLFYTWLLFYAFVPSLINTNYANLIPLLFVLIIMPIMYVTIYILIKSQIENAETKESNNILHLQIQMAQEKITNNVQFEETTKMIRHDLKHHMVLIYDYIENGEIQKAKDYINTLNQSVEKSTPKQFCQNSLINVVLSYYDRIVSEKGIKLITDIRLSENLNISEQDLVVIFSNAIDNAFNHLTQTNTGGDITINSFKDNESILIEIRNPCYQSIQFNNGAPVSDKKSSNHGFGTKSLIHLVEKYDGIYSFSLENNEFIFRCSV